VRAARSLQVYEIYFIHLQGACGTHACSSEDGQLNARSGWIVQQQLYRAE
jgi:hypothetical protein